MHPGAPVYPCLAHDLAQDWRNSGAGPTLGGRLAVDPQAAVEATVATTWKSTRQVAAHAIGDQAVDNFLVAIEKAYAAQGPADHRPIIQHAQFLRPDQIVRAKKVGAITSFTAGGIYPMGDYFARLMGPERMAWAEGQPLQGHHQLQRLPRRGAPKPGPGAALTSSPQR